MEDKRTLFVLILFLLPLFLRGQDLLPPETEDSFYIERTEEGDRFIQRLAWEKADTVHRYEITIEKQNSAGEYTGVLRESRTENFIELSLSPGLYRYRIEGYNLLNSLAGISDWIPFRVFPALQPELYSFTQTFLPTEEGDPRGGIEITLYGMNFVEGAEVYLLPLPSGGDPVIPLAYLPSEESARMLFDREVLRPGRYRVYVRNPGGLEGFLEITVEPPSAASPVEPSAASPVEPPVSVPAEDSAPGSSFDLYVSAGYAPLIPLDGYLFTPFDSIFYPMGASLRIELVPVRQPWGDLGLELAPSWNMLKSDDLKIHIGALHLNGTYHRRFSGQTALVFRLGAGVNLASGTSGGQSTASLFTWIAAINGGIAFRWFTRPVQNPGGAAGTFYIETGVEYTRLFATDSPAGYIRPFLGVGRRF
ncbi:MAG: hypothetical protein LBK64_05870 [Spirochaetaceae bacterium]|jgi:hypothetical protein|nr:hypothetical protein [Spirochaetaceae bacterium]